MIHEINMATYRPRMRMILGIGDSGTGKTNFIGTMPKPVLVFSFDQGFDTIAMQDGIHVVSIQEASRLTPKAWTEFKARFKKFEAGEQYTWADGRVEKYKSIALDGVGPFLCDYCMNYYQYMGSNVDKKASYTQYQQLLENMTDVFNDCKRMAEYVVCTALTKVDKDELTGEIMTLPNLTGSIRDQLAAKFDAVFFFYTNRKPTGEEVFTIKTVAGYREKGKIRLPSDIRQAVAPTIENPDFSRLLALVASKIEAVYGNAPKPTAETPIQPVSSPAPQSPVPATPSGPSAPRPVTGVAVKAASGPVIQPQKPTPAMTQSLPGSAHVVKPPVPVSTPTQSNPLLTGVNASKGNPGTAAAVVPGKTPVKIVPRER